jgi:NADH-quinone oxidoreductase subunit L
VTLLFGAIIGTARRHQRDRRLDHVQIGYMMLAAGLGPVGYTFTIFLLLTRLLQAGMFLGQAR